MGTLILKNRLDPGKYPKHLALDLFKQASEYHWRASYNLCLMYEMGDVVVKDLVMAKQFCEKAHSLASEEQRRAYTNGKLGQLRAQVPDKKNSPTPQTDSSISRTQIPWNALILNPKPKSFNSYSEIYEGKWKTHQVFVKNFLFKKEIQTELARKTFEREVKSLEKLRHPNIIRFFGICDDEDHKAVVMELMTRGDLHNLLYSHNNYKDNNNNNKNNNNNNNNKNNNKEQKNVDSNEMNMCRLKPFEILSIGIQVATGLQYLHQFQPPILHRNIKPTSIFLSGGGVVKIADFGFSKTKEEISSGLSSTIQEQDYCYLAPESNSFFLIFFFFPNQFCFLFLNANSSIQWICIKRKVRCLFFWNVVV